MKKILLIASLIAMAGSASAQSIFPNQPVDPYPGMGLAGEGINMARPWGREGVDCVVNPVSMTYSYNEIERVELVAGQVFTIPVNVLFDFDKDFVRPAGLSDLGNFYTALTEGGAEEILVVGHTDAKGTEEYNLDLGLRRAGAVAAVLVGLGFGYDNIEIDSAGESAPVAPNDIDGVDNPDGRQLNRRVDIEIVRVKETEVVSTEVVRRAKNPQIFQRLGANGVVGCAGGVQQSIGIVTGGSDSRLTPNGGVVITTVPR